MHLLKGLLLAGTACLAVAGTARAADLPTAKPAGAPVSASAAPCGSVQDFFMTACPLTYGGVTFYGTIDVGVGYEKFGAPLNPNFFRWR